MGVEITRHWFGVALGYGDEPADALRAMWRQAKWHAQKAADAQLPNAPQGLAPAARVVWLFDPDRHPLPARPGHRGRQAQRLALVSVRHDGLSHQGSPVAKMGQHPKLV
jgi:hypothetical protein